VLLIDEMMAGEALEVIAHGVCSYISKSWPQDRIYQALVAAAGQIAQPAAADLSEGVSELTAREREIIQLMSRGATNAGIADALSISLSTVKSHVAAAMRKLRTPNRAATVALLLGAHDRHDLRPMTRH